MSKAIHTKFIRDKLQNPFYVRYAVRKEERLDLIANVGVHGLVLFEYYLRISTIEGMAISDEGAAEYFGWNLHTAGRYRRALIKHEWLHVVTAKSDNNNKVILYYLGKDEVQGAKSNQRN